MSAYYNEIDPFAAQWLRNLIAAGHIAPGEVDERSILEVEPADLAGFDQCHFFAGIGVWSHALRLAGWPDDRPVWTGSCPCQPFSAAGKGDEFADERHLWPAWFKLIRERRPVAVFGEQVASKDALAWLDHVCADLEGEGYAIGAVDTCAAGFGAPHIRQRLYFVGHSNGSGLAPRHSIAIRVEPRSSEPAHSGARSWLADADGGNASAEGLQRSGEQRLLAEGGRVGDMADSAGSRSERAREHDGRPSSLPARSAECCVAGRLADTGCSERRPRDAGRNDDSGQTAGRIEGAGRAAQRGLAGELADAEANGLGQGRANDARRDAGTRAQGAGLGSSDDGSDCIMGDPDDARSQGRSERAGAGADQRPAGQASATNGFWSAAEWIACRDGKARPVEPGTFPLAHGATARVGRLRAYGNCIVPQAAAAFVESYMMVEP